MPREPDWYDVGAADALQDDGVVAGVAGGIQVAVFRVGNSLHALHDLCSHGQARLSDGFVENGCVECPLHQGLVEIATGLPRSSPIVNPVQTYRVRVVGGRIEVSVRLF